jgi:5-methylthioadenosine/S-adenosylhomocysteine deaminase
VEKDVLIVTGGYILTCDPTNRGGLFDLLIRDGRIAGIAPDAAAFKAQNPSARLIDARGKLILPGFVNAHFHSESLLLHFLTAGRHLDTWMKDPAVVRRISKLCEPSSHEDLRTLYLTSYFTHLKNGTTLVGEYPPAVDGAGLQVIAEAVGRTDVGSVLALQNWSQVEQARSGSAEMQGFMMNLGSEEEYTVYSIGTAVRTAREAKFPILAHVAERKEAADALKKNFQKNIGAILRDLGALRAETAVAHMNHAVEQDLEVVEEMGSSMIIAPRSAANKQTGCPVLRHLAYRSIRLALGTDWGQPDMLAELRFLAQLPVLVPSVPVFSPLELLRMATINGAHALGVADRTGSLEVGKRADMVFFSLGNLRFPPPPPNPRPRDLAMVVVHQLGAGDISDVMLNGQFCMNSGQLATMTEDDVLRAFARTVEQWYPEFIPEAGHQPKERSQRDEASRPPKVVPLIPRDHTVLAEEEGFEEGFSVIGPDDGTVRAPEIRERRPEPPAAQVEGPREGTKPELPENVQRVFGEDEDL